GENAWRIKQGENQNWQKCGRVESAPDKTEHPLRRGSSRAFFRYWVKDGGGPIPRAFTKPLSARPFGDHGKWRFLYENSHILDWRRCSTGATWPIGDGAAPDDGSPQEKFMHATSKSRPGNSPQPRRGFP